MVTIECVGPQAFMRGNVPEHVHQQLYLQMSWPHARAIWQPDSLKSWDDGRIAIYYPKTGRFPTGCVPRVLHVLDHYGIEAVIDRPIPAPNASLRISNPDALYPYQRTMHDVALQHPYGTLQAPPRSGKTCVAAHWIASLQRTPAIFFVNTIDLCYQAQEELSKWLDTEVGIVGDGHYEPADVTVMSIQSAFASLKACGKAKSVKWRDPMLVEERPLPNHQEAVGYLEDCLVRTCDECHHSSAASHTQTYKAMKSCVFSLGLSATPWCEGGERILIEAATGPVVHVTRKRELIEAGRLVPIHIDIVKVPPKRYPKDTTYATIYADYIVDNEWRNEQIAKWCDLRREEGHTGIVFVRHIRHAKALAERTGATLVTGSVSGEQRKAIWDALRARELDLVVGTVGKEGLDIPVLDGAAMGLGGVSQIQTEQAITRVMTTAEGKTHGHVLDFYDQAKHLSGHSKDRIALYCDDDAYSVRLIENGL